ncbi:hypothetical protein [Sphingomonas sp. IC081]|uniref:hypothetical protein n=1 Tax=Sphingomonas sp. IC081 TaxID=304378 RepID=UPI00115BA21E|nr:hypothetical protein [Sphingomonas sp. IC081]QDK36065.1 hypothetical protein DM450_25500 [Sphingomonas sp. IC081]
MTEPQPQWMPDQDVAYDGARDSINYVVGMCSAALDEEERKEAPNPDRLAFLHLRMRQCAELHSALSFYDGASVADVRRDFGAIIRADRAEWDQKKQAVALDA